MRIFSKATGNGLESACSDCAAVIGLDWADGKHAVCLQVAVSPKREFHDLVDRPEEIDEWARELHKRFAGKPVAIALELAKGPIVYALPKYDLFVLFPINPAALAKYRNVFAPAALKTIPPTPSSQRSSCSSIPKSSSPSTLKALKCEPSSKSSRCADAWSMTRPASLIASPAP
jgi:hypothetical protein